MNTIERARGRWREILPQFGVDVRFLKNRHGPCPVCGGKDRFRFDDKAGEGTYFCNQCGAGTGIILVRKLHDWTHAEACSQVDKIIGNRQASPAVPATARNGASRAAAVQRVVDGARSGTVVAAYLQRRGLTVASSVLLGTTRCPYINGVGRLMGHYPAVIAPITAFDGTLESVQRIYDADLTPRKKIMSPVRTITGAAVRLFEQGDELAITEGVETALAVHEMRGIPTWAALSAGGLEAFVPPLGLKKLHIFSDNDSNMVGQAAAYSLAKRVAHVSLDVEVHVPPVTDSDWLDVLNGRPWP